MTMKFFITIVCCLLYVIPSFSQIMEWYIKDNYTDVQYMGNHLFKVKNASGLWGIVNENGELSIEAVHDSITPLVEDRALLLDRSGKMLRGIINEKGQLVKSFNQGERLANYSYFKEGLLPYGVATNNYYLFGYLDINGNVVIRPNYYWAAPFYNGKAVVQYKSSNYGLIDKSGGPALQSNKKFKFISTPVNNQVLMVYSGTKGDKVVLADLQPNGKIEDETDLENGTIVRGSDDYMSISCQNGHAYYFDAAMRLISSSTGRDFNDEETIDDRSLATKDMLFKTIRDQDGWKISYDGKVLSQANYRDVKFCGDQFAIVTSVNRNKKGVLRINKNANVSVISVPQRAEFYHNMPAKGEILLNVNGFSPSSQVQMSVVGLVSPDDEQLFTLPSRFKGTYVQPVSFFIPSLQSEKEETRPLNVKLYADGMLLSDNKYQISSIHHEGFSISASYPEYSKPSGNAEVSFTIQSLNSSPSSQTTITISGDADINQRFDGKDAVYISIPVKIPSMSIKKFSFQVTVAEEGCPSVSKTVEAVIKHYHLQ